MKYSFLLLSILFQQSSFAQVVIKNNVRTARTNFAVQKLQTVINESKLNRIKQLITLDTAFNNRKESFSILVSKGSKLQKRFRKV
jgi:hypothetical protein